MVCFVLTARETIGPGYQSLAVSWAEFLGRWPTSVLSRCITLQKIRGRRLTRNSKVSLQVTTEDKVDAPDKSSGFMTAKDFSVVSYIAHLSS